MQICVVLLPHSLRSNLKDNNLKILERLVILKKREKTRQTFVNNNVVVTLCCTKKLCDGKQTYETYKTFEG